MEFTRAQNSTNFAHQFMGAQNQPQRISSTLNIGGLAMGGKQPVRIQSMTDTNTDDVTATVNQCASLFDKGCELVRISTPTLRSVDRLAEIRSLLRDKGYDQPLIADVHYSHQVAMKAARVADKIRINPGNYQYQTNVAHEAQLKELVACCKTHDTTIRIGVNHGSMSDRILTQYGNTAAGMVHAAVEYMDWFRALDFHDLVVALKSSDPIVMIEANLRLASYFDQQGWTYPIHLGVTEAGNDLEGRVNSALGIGYLLNLGIGDTIRVSLTEAPENELSMARAIISSASKGQRGIATFDEEIYRLEAALRKESQIPELMISGTKTNKPGRDMSIDDQMIADLVAEWGSGLLLRLNHQVVVDSEEGEEVIVALFQCTGRKVTRPYYISCPGCSRTYFDLQDATQKVKATTAHLKGAKIAVMGCHVNGPGEMSGADYGYVGSGQGKVDLYVRGQRIARAIPEEKAPGTLLEIIENDQHERA